MIRRVIAGSLSFLFLLVLLFNAYLLLNLVGGAQIVREAETKAGYSLSCFELYETESIAGHFYPDRALQGDIIYLSGILFPFWLGVSIGVPLILVFVLGRQQRWHWFPLVLSALLLIAIATHFRILFKLVCALE